MALQQRKNACNLSYRVSIMHALLRRNGSVIGKFNSSWKEFDIVIYFFLLLTLLIIYICFVIQVLTTCLLSVQNAYNIPNSRCTVVPCKTNLPSKKFYSGYGFALAAMLTEIWIDTVADRCGVPHEKVLFTFFLQATFSFNHI